MKERVENLLGDVAKAVTISTIHSFCVRLLREDILELGYPRNFTILDADDQKSILRDAYKQMHIDVKSYSYNSVLSYISNNKTNFIDAATAKASHLSFSGCPACPFIQWKRTLCLLYKGRNLIQRSTFFTLAKPLRDHLDNQPSVTALTT